MGIYMNGRPIAETAIPGLAKHRILVEAAFTILHEGDDVAQGEPLLSLKRELERYQERERESLTYG
jgi:hypothetical protein